MVLRSGRRWLSSSANTSGPVPHAVKKFYKRVSIKEMEKGYGIELDGRLLKTPGRNNIKIPSKSLGLGIAAEWDSQNEFIVPSAMPLMSLTATAIDQVLVEKDFVLDNICKYLNTDTACFLASEADEPRLHQLQLQYFIPLLDWFEMTYHLRLKPGFGILHKPSTNSLQDMHSLQSQLQSWSHWDLAALQCVTQECKSLVIALAFLHNYIDTKYAQTAARLEENAQIDRWGFVEGAHDYDVTRIQFRLASASLFSDFIREEEGNL
uniref:ATP synthase mitochondrial F1 complex assembly factor 2 n=1 Tax=Aureoumbra lagunensis TaxID=44058 RepID=A0A7S3K311_9STRA|mmetsp:Transcript_17465/g.22753  ORF Transcript_17465/g.22753 Transcript_17465/m.22753 type:complete len:265 (+) Transcript_17465:166-960(+)